MKSGTLRIICVLVLVVLCLSVSHINAEDNGRVTPERNVQLLNYLQKMIDRGQYGDAKAAKRGAKRADSWLYIPGQGYVLVHAGEGGNAANGQLMRYGRRR